MRLALIAAAALAAALAGCDRPPTPQVGAPAPGGGAPAPGQQDSTRVIPGGAPTAAEKRESDQPVQGQVDTKEAPQRRDFQERK